MIFFFAQFACSFSHNHKLLNISSGIVAMLRLRGSKVSQQAAWTSVSCVESLHSSALASSVSRLAKLSMTFQGILLSSEA